MQLLAFVSIHIQEFVALDIVALMTFEIKAPAVTLPYFDYKCEESETGCIYILINGIV